MLMVLLAATEVHVAVGGVGHPRGSRPIDEYMTLTLPPPMTRKSPLACDIAVWVTVALPFSLVLMPPPIWTAYAIFSSPPIGMWKPEW